VGGPGRAELPARGATVAQTVREAAGGSESSAPTG
jgi:hypothetical protein